MNQPTGYSVSFEEVEVPIEALVTKFGGQPVWAEPADWPICKSTGNPMGFVCQFVIPTNLFPNTEDRIVYLFMVEGEDGGVANTWLPDGGDNKAIVQRILPGATPTKLPEGPTLQKWYEPKKAKGVLMRLLLSRAERARRECEFKVRLQPYEPEEARPDRDAEHFGGGCKVGGRPDFIQNEEYPSGVGWKLLLQIDSARVPFEINFGDAGIGYLFLSEDGQQAKFLWQCL